jgi:hypothetical protein
MKFNTRDLVTIAVFGVLWGIVEISLGTLLKSFRVPLSGAVLGAIGLTIALIGRLFVPRRGSTLFVGTIACLMKLFSLGGVIIGPMIGILGEAIIAELVLSMGGKPRRGLFILAAGFGELWSRLQPFVTNPLLFGGSLMISWLNMIDQGSRLLRLGDNAVLLIVLGLIAIHLAMGGVSGWFAWSAGRHLLIRMGRASSEVLQP